MRRAPTRARPRVWALDAGWSVAKTAPSGPNDSSGSDRTGRPSRRPMTAAMSRTASPSSADGVPGGAGRRVLEREAEQHGRVERVHGGPALRAVARVAGDARCSRAICGQQPGEPAVARRLWTVRGIRIAEVRTPRSASASAAVDGAAPAADRSRRSAGGSASVEARPGDPRRAGHDREGPVAADQRLTDGGDGRRLLRDRAPDGLLAGEVVAEGEVDRRRRTAPAPARITSRSPSPPRSAVAPAASAAAAEASERASASTVWPCAEQLGDDGRADETGAAGDEDLHGDLREVMGLLSHHRSRRWDTCPITYDGAMGRWEPGARERLVVAAVDLFNEQGYDETTVAQIAERAGVTRSTFFRHFPDKRELLVAGPGDAEPTARRGHRRGAPADATPLDAVAAGLERASERDRADEPRARPPAGGGGRGEHRAAGAQPLKSVGLAAAMAEALRRPRACRTRPPRLAAEMGVLALPPRLRRVVGGRPGERRGAGRRTVAALTSCARRPPPSAERRHRLPYW